MHDCRNTQEQLIDLIFDELEPGASRRLLAEIKLCPPCRAQHQTMSQSLRAFDQVAERVAPQEEYWPGYESRLRARLAEETRFGLWQRLTGFLAGFTLLPAPVSVAVAVALLALVFGGWWWMRQPQRVNNDPMVAGPGNTQALPSPTQAPNPQNDVAQEGGDRQKRKPVTSPRSRRQKNVAPRELPVETSAGTPSGGTEDVMAQFQRPATSPFITPDTTRHFEQAQLLLRSFRNAGVDLDYEKRQSRSLLYQNILLRRDAEAKGNLPAQEVLGALEPLLLDIANLPAKPSRRDVQSVKQRVAQQEMIAVLHTHATQSASFNLGQD